MVWDTKVVMVHALVATCKQKAFNAFKASILYPSKYLRKPIVFLVRSSVLHLSSKLHLLKGKNVKVHSAALKTFLLNFYNKLVIESYYLL